jgi:hypothetical protein
VESVYKSPSSNSKHSHYRFTLHYLYNRSPT